jgi:hypothetical protein
MGFLDALRGKKKLRQPAADRLFAMSTAYVTMQEELGLKPSGQAALAFQRLDTADFDSIVDDMEELLGATGEESGTTIEKRDDSMGYRWMILSDPDMEDLVVGLNAVNEALKGGGYGDRILAAVFPFVDDRGQKVYWIYNIKRGTYSPFVPAGGQENRDNERELRLKAQLERELPVEQDLSRWYALWDIPL